MSLCWQQSSHASVWLGVVPSPACLYQKCSLPGSGTYYLLQYLSRHTTQWPSCSDSAKKVLTSDLVTTASKTFFCFQIKASGYPSPGRGLWKINFYNITTVLMLGVQQEQQQVQSYRQLSMRVGVGLHRFVVESYEVWVKEVFFLRNILLLLAAKASNSQVQFKV